MAGCASSVAEPPPEKSTPSTSREDCIFQSVVRDWAPIDNERLLIFGPGRHEAYLAYLSFPSPDLAFDIRIAIVDGDNNGRICGHGTDAVVLRTGAMPDRITIRSMRRVEKAEADALLKSVAKERGKKIPPEPEAGAARQ